MLDKEYIGLFMLRGTLLWVALMSCEVISAYATVNSEQAV